VLPGTELHNYAGDDKVKLKVLISALENAKKRLAGFGEFIPVSYLEKSVNLKGAHLMSRQPVDKHTGNIDKIIGCIRNVEQA